MKLDARSLEGLTGPVTVPTYDRRSIAAGIVHIGVGGFHRAHQAMYVDRLLEAGQAREWGIIGVGVLPGDRRMRDALTSQDGLYSLTLKHSDGTWETQVVGSILDYLHAPDDPERVIEQMAASSTRIVSLTITEGGYNISAADGRFDESAPAVLADLEPDAVPATTFGLVVEALRRRRDRGLAPFTIMSCDNIENNGDVARRSFLGFAQLRDPSLATWLDDLGAFPSSMVDRITPATTPQITAEVAERTGVDDAWPVVCEPFAQWVLEDDFRLGRPPFEQAGVQLVDDVRPYELMKLRLLNASHQGICYFGHLAGFRLVDEAASDPLFAEFLLAYMSREAIATLEPVPGIDLEEYCHTLIERFSNPQVGDTIARLCAESSDRIPTWLLPVVRENLAAGGQITLSAAIVASWARYAEGVDEQGEPIEVVDALRDTLVPLARRQHEDPSAFIGHRAVFGDLVDDERFMAPFVAHLRSLHERGARATLRAALDG